MTIPIYLSGLYIAGAFISVDFIVEGMILAKPPSIFSWFIVGVLTLWGFIGGAILLLSVRS